MDEAVRVVGLVTVRFRDRLPEDDLGRYAAILLDGMGAKEDRARIAEHSDLAWRARLLADVAACPGDRLWQLDREGALPLHVFGTPVDDARVRSDLADLLLAAPAARHLAPILKRICTGPQQVLVAEFIRRVGARSPGGLARMLSRSRRSLTRDCDELRLRSPQVLFRASRVSRGLGWAHHHRDSEAHAAVAAGYGDTESYRRATRELFGVPPVVLLGEWHDVEALAGRYRGVLLRG
ncbi:MAG: hypothetical protein Q8N53_24070 [Longimicrobiales bacterium]|nr:hypothetical protein [Longimicrobiales bacterium]